jgi:hypothetical protein
MTDSEDSSSIPTTKVIKRIEISKLFWLNDVNGINKKIR